MYTSNIGYGSESGGWTMTGDISVADDDDDNGGDVDVWLCIYSNVG